MEAIPGLGHRRLTDYWAWSAIDLAIAAAQFIAIADSNGSGKSTLLQVHGRESAQRGILEGMTTGERRLLGWNVKPSEKLAQREVIVRSVTDTQYPAVDDARSGRMSSWVKLETYDFYHNGLVVILHLDRGILDRDGNWAI